MSNIEIIEWRELKRNSLLGFAKVRFPSAQHDYEVFHGLGPRVGFEFYCEVAAALGGWPLMTRLIREYAERMRPDLLAVTGGDRMVVPFRLHEAHR